MKLSFSGITKQLSHNATEGAVLYAASKGYHVADKLASKILPISFSGPVRSLAVALGYTILADQFVSKKYAAIVGMAAMSQAIAGFVDPYLDPMLVKQGLLDPSSMTAAALVTSTTTATATGGYSRVGGYSSARMGGYSGAMAGMGAERSNFLGLPA